ncbi:hypothetical protein BRADI_2g33657v3 [Brachypodium distachyon]|uniref:Uncharacterized protein n=1 Tax=Brachypodium distachyon TaxID=15368 RepID=A0A2K2DBL8_BRADI|nr:hypothetical protein BRADI_2g33657v3 [Brachypodium distachyon]PNT71684.1 hypothetical protein BRADI_2g33657v3 [Brachypodium distachyon]
MRGGNSDDFCRCQVCLGKYTLLGDEENPRLAMFERSLPFFGCGIGWCCFLLGFLCPLIWYIAALLYCCKYYNRDPRERPGLAASAVLRYSLDSFIHPLLESPGEREGLALA